MPKPRLLYLERIVTRHGKSIYYFRRSRQEPRLRLPAHPYDSPEAMAAYRTALASDTPAKAPHQVARGSFRWLCDQWRQSSDFLLKAKGTQRYRANILARILDVPANANMPIAKITKADIVAGRERRMATPHAANNYLKTMKALFSWAKDVQLVSVDPAAEVKKLVKSSDGHIPWTHDEIELFRARWPGGTAARVAFETIYFTGLRRGDACALGRQHIGKDGMARIRMEKTKGVVSFAIHPYLASIWEQGPAGDLTFICGERGKPMTKESLGNAFRQWCKAAGVNKSAHGLRKLAAGELGEAGGSELHMQGAFGWETIGQSSTYTRGARRDELSRQAGEIRSKNISIPKPKHGLGNKG
jgi:integrase